MRKYLPWLVIGGFAAYLGYSVFKGIQVAGIINNTGPEIDQQLDRKIWEILGQYESGRNYSAINESELSYGWLQAYLGASLYELIALYRENRGQYAAQFEPYMPQLQARTRALLYDENLKQLLRDAGNDPIMHKTQWDFFHIMYLNPAFKVAKLRDWKLPISYLALADSFIHNGMDRTVGYFDKFQASGNEYNDLMSFLNVELADIRARGKEESRALAYIQALQSDPMLAQPFMVRNTSIAGYAGYAGMPAFPVYNVPQPAHIQGYYNNFGPYNVIGANATHTFHQTPQGQVYTMPRRA